MFVTRDEMKSVEDAAFVAGATPEGLMDSAAAAIAREITKFVPGPGRAIAFCGKGHNAGDALAACSLLAERGWEIGVRPAFTESSLAPLAAKHLARLRERAVSAMSSDVKPLVLLDGLLGIGASGAPREPVARAIREINALRDRSGAFVVAADIPSGLDADSGEPADPCVVADLTVTIGLPKRGLVADGATGHVGRLALALIPELWAPEAGAPGELLIPEVLAASLPPRGFDSHKGTWGRIGVIAGSPGYLGAARLCAEGALRAGGGLVTLYAAESIYPQLAAACSPEVMVKPVKRLRDALGDPHDAIAVGPGLGGGQDIEILELFDRAAAPGVFDADALNALARHPRALANAVGPRLLTPHPGEMARIFPDARSLSRVEAARAFAAKYPHVVLLKGARTVIARAGDPPAFNTTGNPGMGTGGMGDVLTGVCAALLGRKIPPADAAKLGAWLCGRAADFFVASAGGSEESLVASEVPRFLGAAIRDLRESAASPQLLSSAAGW